MASDIESVGRDWLIDQVDGMADEIIHVGPVQFNEENRYLPQGVTPRPGFIRFSLFPFFREILECFDPLSPVREVNLRKGVQVGYTTLLESVLFYNIGFIKTQAGMFITADKELASGRMEHNILPMLNESGMSELIRTADTGNARKTGKTKDYLQWEGGGFLIYNGAQNAGKMRQYSVPLMLKDELDGWPRTVGKDGNSDSLTDDRLKAYWNSRKILRGSTPLTEPSMIQEAYLRGDQRKYLVRCKRCSYPQEIKHRKPNTETGVIRGFQWEMNEGSLVVESVRYCCLNCGESHYETDKERLFATEHGAYWKPTAAPAEQFIRSYSLPAFYSPYGFGPWSKCISSLLDSYDVEAKQVRDIGKYQTYYNNVLGKPFKILGSKIGFRSVSSHRRAEYRLGEVPNNFASEHTGSKILFLTCQVDVHKRNLAVSVMGWTVGARCFLVDYWRFERSGEDDDCREITSPVWGRLREVIEHKTYTADDGSKYGIKLTLVDAGHAHATILSFCADYASGVYPILGRDRADKSHTIKEFVEFTTQAGTVGYKIVVDHYKDRLGPVLRREWVPEAGDQPIYHFNAPVDTTDKQLTELTREYQSEKVDNKGNVVYYWHRPGTATPNELWDLLVYGHAAVEILAWFICIKVNELKTVDWDNFWSYAVSEENNDVFNRLA